MRGLEGRPGRGPSREPTGAARRRSADVRGGTVRARRAQQAARCARGIQVAGGISRGGGTPLYACRNTRAERRAGAGGWEGSWPRV
jgi:hypothetical protein